MTNVVISDIHDISRAWKYKLDNIPVLNLEQTYSMYKMGLVSKIIVPRERLATQEQSRLILELRENVCFDDILLTPRIRDKNQSIEKYLEASYLPYLEFHVADHCNLNCAACQHFSAIADPVMHTANDIKRDLLQLSKYISDIGVIRIMGGEPLLNPEISEIIGIVRNIYAESSIYVVTNGMLLKRMSSAFFEKCLVNEIILHISYYLPMVENRPYIEKMLNEYGVKYVFSELNTYFLKKYTLEPCEDAEKVFSGCIQSCCNNLYDGQMAACFLPFTQKYFNNNFEKELPTDGAVSLYDENLTTYKLKSHLQKPFKRCCYCSKEDDEIRWHVTGNSINEWIK